MKKMNYSKILFFIGAMFLVAYNINISTKSNSENGINLMGINISTMVNDTFATGGLNMEGVKYCESRGDLGGDCYCTPPDPGDNKDCKPIGSEWHW